MTPRWLVNEETADLKSTTCIYLSTKDGGWYFWDETGTSAFGPFQTMDECLQSLDRYASSL